MRHVNNNAGTGAIYGLGLIGSAIFFVSKATGFWMGVAGFFKAIVWPAIFVYKAFEHFGL